MLHSATPHLLLIKADFDPINNAVQLKDAQNLGSMPVTSLLAKVELIPIIKESSREKRSYDRVTTLKSALDQAYVLNNIQRFKDTQSQHTSEFHIALQISFLLTSLKLYSPRITPP